MSPAGATPPMARCLPARVAGLAAGLVAACLSGPAAAQACTVGPQTLRGAPRGGGEALRELDANSTVAVLAQQGPWLQVRTAAGATGFLPRAAVEQTWIKVHKQERSLLLMEGDREVKRFRVALSQANPLQDKVRQGDRATPEGRFYIAEMQQRPGAARYGARSMRLSYPDVEDARRGLAQGLLRRKDYWAIVRAVRAGKVPPQGTRLGGSIRIHGGGSAGDWTLGCVALDDADAVEVFARARVGTRVEIYRSAAADQQLNRPGEMGRRVLAGALAQLTRPALYTSGALGLHALRYPMGDISAEQAVCTDVVIRALRQAGLDLQAAVHEDATLHPRRYRRVVRRPNPNIDHRRARTLHAYLSHHAEVHPPDGDYQAGDIVIMDTGIANGTAYDHIGVVDASKTAAGLPRVINIWTVGYRTASMDLLGKAYPTIVGHFRLGPPLGYTSR